MMRVEEACGDVVRLLVQTVRVRDCHTSQLPQQQQQQCADGAVALAEPKQAIQTECDRQDGCEVLYEEESRWLLISEVFSPDIPR